MRAIRALAAIVLACLAAPVAAENISVIVRNESRVPKAVPVYWVVDGEEGETETNSKGRADIDIDCKKTFKVFLSIYDVIARSIAPKAHSKCPIKKEMEFVVRQN